MKLIYKQKLNYWANSTGSLKYYPDLKQATSYDHWVILKKVNNKLIVNRYSYSVTTSRHVTALCSFLYTHFNIQPFLTIDCPINLNQDNCLTEYMQFLLVEIEQAKKLKKREAIASELNKLNQILYEYS